MYEPSRSHPSFDRLNSESGAVAVWFDRTFLMSSSFASTMVTLFTVFIGLVVSFAATGSIGNALSGLVIMSWRPYKDGDRVEVAGGTYVSYLTPLTCVIDALREEARYRIEYVSSA